jgi:hypothetical protein
VSIDVTKALSELRGLSLYLTSSIKGIEALQLTYMGDANTVAKFDLIRNQVDEIISNIDEFLGPKKLRADPE